MKFYSFKDLFVHGLGRYLSQGTTLIDSDEGPTNYDVWSSDNPSQSAFLEYSSFGLMDPKMPIEYKVMGPGYVAVNVLGVGALLWYVDPMQKRPGGLDDIWYSGFNPTYNWPGQVWDEATSIVPESPPNPWTLVPGW